MACYSLRKLLFTFQSTPSVGRATQYEENSAAYWLISIHALRGEGDHFHNCFGGTFACISIHALRGEGDFLLLVEIFNRFFISIHALRGEGDHDLHYGSELFNAFQSTPSVGRAT